MPHHVWDYSGIAEPRPYGPDTTYQLGMSWLAETCSSVEDWGCGYAYARRFAPAGCIYTGVDASPGFADVVAELDGYTSSPDGILMRHVLEHNDVWRMVLENALKSFRKRFALVMFTPWTENTFPLVPHEMLDIGFRKQDVTGYLEPFEVREQHLVTATQYGQEHIFYVEHRDQSF